MLKLSKRDKKMLGHKAKNDLEHIRKALKKEPIVIDMFKKYDRKLSDIDNVPIKFVDGLDVSAKTINGHIFLNAEMLKENWKDYFHYMIHEMDHVLQHLSNKCVENSNEENYLDNPAEIEAFQEQLKYREKTEDRPTINQYIDGLLDKHDIPKNERQEKKDELLGKK